MSTATPTVEAASAALMVPFAIYVLLRLVATESRRPSRRAAGVRGALIASVVMATMALACTTGPVEVQTGPSVAPSPIPTDQASGTPAQSATFDAPTASRILTRLDALQRFYASGDAAGIGAWSSEESAWADEHLAGLPTGAVEVSAYLANVRALRSAVDAGRDLNDGVVALLAMRETIAEAVGLPTPP